MALNNNRERRMLFVSKCKKQHLWDTGNSNWKVYQNWVYMHTVFVCVITLTARRGRQKVRFNT